MGRKILKFIKITGITLLVALFLTIGLLIVFATNKPFQDIVINSVMKIDNSIYNSSGFVQRDKTLYEIEFNAEQTAKQKELLAPLLTEKQFESYLETEVGESLSRKFYEKVPQNELSEFIDNCHITEFVLLNKPFETLMQFATIHAGGYSSTEFDKYFDPYLPTKLSFEQSTEQEFALFIKDYFEALGYPAQFDSFGDNNTVNYTVEWVESEPIWFVFYQTQYLEERDFDLSYSGDYYKLIKPIGHSVFSQIHSEHYLASSNGKFLLQINNGHYSSLFLETFECELFTSLGQ